MKISDILKNQGVFSNEIKARFSNGQIRINGEIIKDDIELKIIDTPFEAGDWIFQNLITKLNSDKKQLLLFFVNLFDIETLFSGECQIDDKPIEEIFPELNVLKDHVFLRTSKKQFFIFKTF